MMVVVNNCPETDGASFFRESLIWPYLVMAVGEVPSKFSSMEIIFVFSVYLSCLLSKKLGLTFIRQWK